ncbi:transporter substrate-binding domain-containing protein [Pigmentibacter sp. JX0631]|uniref:substrate-binding periplasmic protein n=1 Tax=Pigmentibacter sp. JX0631 TaxID=2976982 RepID=UPI0024695E19|nr:transporter substrate-binding domain-containing protein [Pigmentibacter sp. JX0631]WGL61351.1 transporter substrate-binding domain-containing protein [Pigmentibacter sp. JX0631]
MLFKFLTLSLSIYNLSALPKSNISFCYEDQDSYPWVLKNGTGLNIEHLKLVGKKLQINIHFMPMPWNRCLEELRKGDVDAAFAGSYKAERIEFGYYPTLNGKLDGKVDESKRLHTNQYSLYVLKGENIVKWDGKNILGLSTVGSLTGYSINEFFIKKNIRVDDGTRLPISILEKLLNKRFNAIALQDNRADYIINSNPKFKNSIIKLTPPLEKKSYFLIISKKFKEEEPILSNKIWDNIQDVRESKEFQKLSKEFLKN